MPTEDSPDPFDLNRFVAAQDDGSYTQAIAELRAGVKRSHWMWFVFPQSAGLGRSAMARRYAITGLDEANAYLDHPVLGPRLLECCAALLADGRSDAVQLLGAVDAQKLQSSMTLFQAADPDQLIFGQVLLRYYGGQVDSATLQLLLS